MFAKRLVWILFFSFLQFNFILADKLCCDLNNMCHDGVVCETDDMYILSEDTSYMCEDNSKLCNSCGDNILDIFAFETCDDGNLYDGDGCDQNCIKECAIITTYDKVDCGNDGIKYFIDDMLFYLDCGSCISSPYDNQYYIKYICEYGQSYISVFEDKNCNNLITIYQHEIEYTNSENDFKKDTIERKSCNEAFQYVNNDYTVSDTLENMVIFQSNELLDIRCYKTTTDDLLIDDNSIVYFNPNFNDQLIGEEENNNSDLIINTNQCLYSIRYWFSELYNDGLCSFPKRALEKQNNIMLDELYNIFKLNLDKSEFEELKIDYFILILNKYNGYNFNNKILNLIDNFEDNYNNKPSNIYCDQSLCTLLCQEYNIDKCNYLSLFERILSSEYNKHCFANPIDLSSEFIFNNDKLTYQNKCIKEGNELINLVDKSNANKLCGLNENTKWTIVYEDKYTYQIPQMCCENCEMNNNNNAMFNDGVINFFNNNIQSMNHNDECFCLTSFESMSDCEGETVVDRIVGVFGETCISIDSELGVIPFSNGTISFFEDNMCNIISISQNLFYPICLTGLGNLEFDVNINEIECNSNGNDNNDIDVSLIVGIVVAVFIVVGILCIIVFMFGRARFLRYYKE